MFPYPALEHLEHSPPGAFQLRAFASVAAAIRPELRLPELAVRSRQAQSTRRAAVPEAAMNEDRDPSADECHVSTSATDATIHAIATISRRSECGAELQLRGGVLRSIRAHRCADSVGGRRWHLTHGGQRRARRFDLGLAIRLTGSPSSFAITRATRSTSPTTSALPMQNAR